MNIKKNVIKRYKKSIPTKLIINNFLCIYNLQISNFNILIYLLHLMDDRRYEKREAKPSQKIYISNLNIDVGPF